MRTVWAASLMMFPERSVDIGEVSQARDGGRMLVGWNITS